MAHTSSPSYSGDWGRRIAWVWEAEIVVSQDHATALQSGLPCLGKKKKKRGQVQWLTSVIPALWEAKAGWSLESWSLRPGWPTWQNTVSTKSTKKLAGYGGGSGWRVDTQTLVIMKSVFVFSYLWISAEGDLKKLMHFGRLRQVDHKVRSSRPAWPTWWNPISTKNTKIGQVRWLMPVIPATWEAEVGESLEPRRWKLRWPAIEPLHSSLGNKSEIPCWGWGRPKCNLWPATWKDLSFSYGSEGWLKL